MLLRRYSSAPSGRALLHRCARGASDPWMKVKSLPEDTLAALANVLEVRAAEPAQAAIRQAVMVDALEGVSGAAICEVGCGTGAVARHLASLPDVSHVIGVDPSPAFLDRARSIGSERAIEYVAGDGTALPISDASQDVVVLWTLLAHVPVVEQPQVLAEARRVLKQNGRIVLFDNDVCAWTFGIMEADPMQRAVNALTHAYIGDPYLSRGFPSLLEVRTAAMWC